MRRRRSRNRSETPSGSLALGKLLRLLVLLVVLLPIAEWGASAIMARMSSNSRLPAVSDKDLAKLYDTDQPGRRRQILVESPGPGDGVYAPLVEYRMPAQKGEWVSVGDDGSRGGIMGQSGPRIAVFGGGTTFGHGLADAETIPAALVAALLQGGIAARVENRAVPGWYSTQDRVAFAEMLTDGDKPDVAVFVHGLDDFMRCGKPEGTAWSARLAEVGAPIGLEQVIRQSSLAALLRKLGGKSQQALDKEQALTCSSDSQVEASLARLDANRRLIAAMAERFGVKVLFVQQPVPTFHYDNAKRAVPMGPDQMAPYVATAKGYARLAEKRGTGSLFEQDLLWLAEFEPAEGNAYVDAVHYSPAFAKLIGEKLAERLAQMLPPPTQPEAPSAPTSPAESQPSAPPSAAPTSPAVPHK
ncbi:MAG: SGNH/GDSL hydrolase family protein [Magnetospirillum gryphiswaldense]|nr:SGNH/GDSL hydrolase family protein [Magnetospirillum gryphiswaldense]